MASNLCMYIPGVCVYTVCMLHICQISTYMSNDCMFRKKMYIIFSVYTQFFLYMQFHDEWINEYLEYGFTHFHSLT